MKPARMRSAAAVYVALFAGMTAVSAYIRLPLPWVPVTLQTALVLLSGIILGPRYGPLSQGVYIAMGLLGFPVFAKGGGLAYVEQPSFGYLLGFIPAAWASGLLVGNWRSAAMTRVAAAAVAGLALIYAAGAAFLYGIFFPLVQGKDMALLTVFQIGVLPFVPFDLLKVVMLLPIIALLRRREHLFPDLGGRQ